MDIERCEPYAEAATERCSLKRAVPKFSKYKEKLLKFSETLKNTCEGVRF